MGVQWINEDDRRRPLVAPKHDRIVAFVMLIGVVVATLVVSAVSGARVQSELDRRDACRSGVVPACEAHR